MIMLIAINAKYIHSNLGVYSLKSYLPQEYQNKVKLLESTINEQKEYILAQIAEQSPQVVAFSCYIWNREYVMWLAKNLKKIMPEVVIAAGGPEVSYDSVKMLEEYPFFDVVMKGEGEETFREVVQYWSGDKETLEGVAGVTFRNEQGEVKDNQWREVMNMDEIPFPYDGLEGLEHRIIYYESSRGCPFSCSYCLSSVEKQVRFRSLSIVKKELAYFLQKKVPQVKFVDRTFNCNHERTLDLWRFIQENDNGVTNFHFEISADLLNDEEIDLLATLRKGLVQLEIGVQSTNLETIRQIRRKTDLDKLRDVVARIHQAGNIHQHLDLIAGLPEENLESFHRSFNDVYAMKPDQLQLGFLKVLKGSLMKEKAQEYGILYDSEPPYEVLATKWISYKEIRELKGIEEMVEVYSNSLQFMKSMAYLVTGHDDAYTMFAGLYHFYETHELMAKKHSRMSRYIYLLQYIEENEILPVEDFAQVLTYDLYSRDNVKNPPEFVKNFHSQKGKLYYEAPFSIDMEWLEATGEIKRGDFMYHFDYEHRDELTHNATITKEELRGKEGARTDCGNSSAPR